MYCTDDEREEYSGPCWGCGTIMMDYEAECRVCSRRESELEALRDAEEEIRTMLEEEIKLKALIFIKQQIARNIEIVREVIENGDTDVLRVLREGYTECLMMLDNAKY